MRLSRGPLCLGGVGADEESGNVIMKAMRVLLCCAPRELPEIASVETDSPGDEECA